MEGVVAPLQEGDDDEFCCNECFKTFIAGETRFHSTTEEETDYCSKCHDKVLKETPDLDEIHKFELVLYK